MVHDTSPDGAVARLAGRGRAREAPRRPGGRLARARLSEGGLGVALAELCVRAGHRRDGDARRRRSAVDALRRVDRARAAHLRAGRRRRACSRRPRELGVPAQRDRHARRRPSGRRWCCCVSRSTTCGRTYEDAIPSLMDDEDASPLVVVALLAVRCASCIFGGSSAAAPTSSPSSRRRWRGDVRRGLPVRVHAAVRARHHDATGDHPGSSRVTSARSTRRRRLRDGKPIDDHVLARPQREGEFACNSTTDVGIRCTKTALARTSFGTAKLDVFFDTPREEGAFASVRKAATPERIAGQQGTCFEAVPAPPSPGGPASAAADADRAFPLRALLRRGRDPAARQADHPGRCGDGRRTRESFVEVASVSRVVEPR